MEKKPSLHAVCSGTDTHPFVVGDLYAHTYTHCIVLLTGLDYVGDGWGWSVEFVRLHDWRTFYATYTASEWCEHWEHMTH
jgi:hypothetical protein